MATTLTSAASARRRRSNNQSGKYEPVRSFGTFTKDLHRLVDWFAECGVDTVVMESTSVYWIPIFELLDARGFTVFLVNARDAKHVPGRKTDVSDAEWLQRLHSYGLLRASFRPKGRIVELRAYLRQRERLLEYGASHIQHMQKALTEMNVQLHHVVTDITGATGLVGNALVPFLTASGHEVLRITRRPRSSAGRVRDIAWDPARGHLDAADSDLRASRGVEPRELPRRPRVVPGERQRCTQADRRARLGAVDRVQERGVVALRHRAVAPERRVV